MNYTQKDFNMVRAKIAMDKLQNNVCACKVCRTMYSEESGAENGFICEDCLNIKK